VGWLLRAAIHGHVTRLMHIEGLRSERLRHLFWLEPYLTVSDHHEGTRWCEPHQFSELQSFRCTRHAFFCEFISLA
jgi:hypothetical protein